MIHQLHRLSRSQCLLRNTNHRQVQNAVPPCLPHAHRSSQQYDCTKIITIGLQREYAHAAVGAAAAADPELHTQLDMGVLAGCVSNITFYHCDYCLCLPHNALIERERRF